MWHLGSSQTIMPMILCSMSRTFGGEVAAGKSVSASLALSPPHINLNCLIIWFLFSFEASIHSMKDMRVDILIELTHAAVRRSAALIMGLGFSAGMTWWVKRWMYRTTLAKQVLLPIFRSKCILLGLSLVRNVNSASFGGAIGMANMRFSKKLISYTMELYLILKRYTYFNRW
jgi:hypothetical protein